MKRITEMPLQLYISFGSIKRSKTNEDFASGEYLLRNYIREHDCKLWKSKDKDLYKKYLSCY